MMARDSIDEAICPSPLLIGLPKREETIARRGPFYFLVKDAAVLLKVIIDEKHLFFGVEGSRSVPLEARVAMLSFHFLQIFGHQVLLHGKSIDISAIWSQANFFWSKFTFWSCRFTASETLAKGNEYEKFYAGIMV